MNVHPRSVRLVPLLVVALLAGCSAFGLPGPSTPAATPTPPAPTPPDLLLATGAAPADRYRLAGFDPAITIELDGSWQSLAQQRGFASVTQVQRPLGSNPYHAGALIQITMVDGLPADGDGSIKLATVAEAVDALKARLGTMFLESTDSKLGGLAGTQATIERPGDGPPMSMDVVEVIDVPPGTIVLSQGTKLWIAFFEQRDGLVAVIVNSTTKSWDADLAAAEPVLESIRFELP